VRRGRSCRKALTSGRSPGIKRSAAEAAVVRPRARCRRSGFPAASSSPSFHPAPSNSPDSTRLGKGTRQAGNRGVEEPGGEPADLLGEELDVAAWPPPRSRRTPPSPTARASPSSPASRGTASCWRSRESPRRSGRRSTAAARSLGKAGAPSRRLCPSKRRGRRGSSVGLGGVLLERGGRPGGDVELLA